MFFSAKRMSFSKCLHNIVKVKVSNKETYTGDKDKFRAKELPKSIIWYPNSLNLLMEDSLTKQRTLLLHILKELHRTPAQV